MLEERGRAEVMRCCSRLRTAAHAVVAYGSYNHGVGEPLLPRESLFCFLDFWFQVMRSKILSFEQGSLLSYGLCNLVGSDITEFVIYAETPQDKKWAWGALTEGPRSAVTRI